MGLDRRHALIVVDDTEVSGVFKKECISTWEDGWCAWVLLHSGRLPPHLSQLQS